MHSQARWCSKWIKKKSNSSCFAFCCAVMRAHLLVLLIKVSLKLRLTPGRWCANVITSSRWKVPPRLCRTKQQMSALLHSDGYFAVVATTISTSRVAKTHKSEHLSAVKLHFSSGEWKLDKNEDCTAVASADEGIEEPGRNVSHTERRHFIFVQILIPSGRCDCGPWVLLEIQSRSLGTARIQTLFL